MPIVTSIQPFTLWRNTGFAALCLIFALWGWYDYEYKIPRLERDSAAYQAAKDTRSNLEKAAETAELRPEQITELEAARTVLDDIKDRYGNAVPSKPQAYDRQVQLWLYIIGCGVLGVPMFAWPIVKTMRRPYRLDDDGTLRTPEGTFPAEQIVDIDMTRWCSPTGDRRSTWTAKLILKDGRKVLLDDHDHRNMDMIIGAYAHRFHPDQWTKTAKRVGEASVPDPATGSTNA
ncbi:MAG: hypothetical protein EBQ99_07430 [Planctomycetes bacterium]|nr:hypothetical protein [Planctomycetota bacterium]